MKLLYAISISTLLLAPSNGFSSDAEKTSATRQPSREPQSRITYVPGSFRDGTAIDTTVTFETNSAPPLVIHQIKDERGFICYVVSESISCVKFK